MYYASPKHERLYKNIIRGKEYSAKTLAAQSDTQNFS